MAMRELVEGECGGANALMKLSTHMTQDRTLRPEGASAWEHRVGGATASIPKPVAVCTEDEVCVSVMLKSAVALLLE
ncbi:UNVERIFIED_CONTAM: hypothetical protein FKN15_021527 [Acipenser sinensis]